MSTQETPIDVDSIEEDHTLQQMEKETILRVAKDQNRVHIHTDVAGVMRRLVQHPEFQLEDANRYDGSVTAVRGTLPLGCVSVRMKPRKHGSHADIITSGVLRSNEG